MTQCISCGRDVSRFKIIQGNCLTCAQKALQTKTGLAHDNPASSDEAELAHILLTTETAHNLPVDRRLDIVTAEVVIGLHIFKDIAGAFRDTFGGRSKTMQDSLREARKTALAELRREAHMLGAHAVVGVDLDYSEISGGGKSMLFLVASGTAVTLHGIEHGEPA